MVTRNPYPFICPVYIGHDMTLLTSKGSAPWRGQGKGLELTGRLLQEGILRSFRLYVIFRACPGNVVM